jgi:hypothetical protein
MNGTLHSCNGSYSYVRRLYISSVSFLKDRQGTCNVTLRRVRVSIVAVEKQQALQNLCVYL